MSTDAYTECLAAMYGMRRFGIILGLSTISNILEGLGNPQDTFSAIHIAGTNGKGSTAMLVSRLLQAHGLSVGTYSSPHVSQTNERFRHDGEPISDDDLALYRVTDSVDEADEAAE